MSKHQEMENTICKEVTNKLRAAGNKVTEKNVVSKCNEFCREIAEEKNLRYYLAGASTNFLFYEDDHCVKVDWLNNPQVQAIEISEAIIKFQQESGAGVFFG